LIIVCQSCQAQYSVPDAKVQGRKVRVTCKHCGYGIIVDGMTAPPPPAPKLAPFETVPAIFDALSVADDDATRVMKRPLDFSVHDEPTVVGRIPVEALEAERRFAQRTVPPPPGGEEPAATESAPAPPPTPLPLAPALPGPELRALPYDVPESVIDSTRAASPQAMAMNHASLPPLDSAEIKTLLSEQEYYFPRPKVWPWVLGAVFVIVVLIGLAVTH
jgi:predicted Zn finger-like uncharacterized protein